MDTLYAPLGELNEFNLIRQHLKKNCTPIQLSGCVDSQMVHFMQGLGEGFRNKIILTFSETKAKEIYEDVKLYDRQAMLYPAKDFIFFSADIQGNLILQERLETVKRLAEGEECTIVMSVDALMDKILPLEEIQKNILSIEIDGTVEMEALSAKLSQMGYERSSQVEMAGQFAIRGSIADIFPLTQEVPIRIDLWGDSVDSIKSFDVQSQRSIENLDEVKIYPAAEFILTEGELRAGVERIKAECDSCEKKLRGEMKTEEAHRLKTSIYHFCEQISFSRVGVAIDSFVEYFYDKLVSLFDYFQKEETVWFLDEPVRMQERMEAVETEFRESMMHRLEKGYVLAGQTDVLWRYSYIFGGIAGSRSVLFTALEQKLKEFKVAESYYIQTKNMTTYNNSFELLCKDLQRYRKKGYRVLILSNSRTKAKRLAEDMTNEGITAFYSEDNTRILQAGEVMTAYGNLHKGFEYPMIRFAVISQSDIFGTERRKKKRKKSQYSGQKIQSFTDLNIGDYVVHENHGLGIYRGIEQVEVNKQARDYIKIEYGGNGALYILATQLDRIQKYAGADAAKVPKLNKLGSQEWHKTKSRVRSGVQDIAKELVELYAKRQAKSGFPFGADTVWQREFEELFPFEETEDQLRAIEDTKKDMESEKIMDRLVCGDVGYGKTEIAIRAAFKAVGDGKQVVFLVPTTILAQQHYNTFSQRMKDFPVRVDLMSRFRTPAQQKATLAALKRGEVDILIGTHRVLSKDIVFKDLGLLIVDEEQRFGVTHKEKIKTLKENVDVLTLTATPIPRTLHMSLIGIRDMSVLEEAPVDRLPIQTYVMEYNDEMVREAINRELARNGQVYYVYNRVNNIEEIAGQVQKLVPDAVVTYAHGQMSERKLEQIMYDFMNGEIDVLVSTTIIETGLDISNANTMIIHDADQLGLSQMYQLRGRVGRSSRTSYAFLMYKRDKMLKEVAEKRLQAIRDFTELGSGIKIAMRDLEIRGAGNILGAQQHGHMEAVGYDLYCKMLNEAVSQLKGITPREDFETTIDIAMDAFIPSSYIRNEYQKLDVYKRIAGIENQEEYEDMQDELIDRFGDMPKSVVQLLDVALLKAKAHELDIEEIKGISDQVKITMYEKAQIQVDQIEDFVKLFSGRMKFMSGKQPYFVYHYQAKEKDTLEKFEKVCSIVEQMRRLKQ